MIAGHCLESGGGHLCDFPRMAYTVKSHTFFTSPCRTKIEIFRILAWSRAGLGLRGRGAQRWEIWTGSLCIQIFSSQTERVWAQWVWKIICSSDSLFLWKACVKHKVIPIRSFSVGGNEGADSLLADVGKLSCWLIKQHGQGHSASG